jgi:hypothetical protein
MSDRASERESSAASDREADPARGADLGSGRQQTSTQLVLGLQRHAGNAAVARLIAQQRETPAPAEPEPEPLPLPPAANRVRRLQRQDYSVVPAMEAEDKNRFYFDPADKQRKPVWTAEGGYAKNPTARPLKDVISSKGRVGEGFDNGVYTYVVDGNGDVVIAKRLGEPGTAPGRATGMPHPTLIGGKTPKVMAAGEVEIRGGLIYKIDNQSGHFQPARKAMGTTVKGFLRVPSTAFHPKFQAESVHYDAAGVRTTKPFRTLRTLKLKGREFKSALRGLKPGKIATRLRGKLKSRSFRSGAKSAGGAFAGALVMLALEYLLGKLMESVYEGFIERQIDEKAPEVEAKLAERQDELDALLEADSEADVYVNVRFSIDLPHVSTYSPDTQGPVTIDVPPVVFLHSVGYSRQPWDPKPIEERETSCGASVDKTIVTASQPVNVMDFFTDEETRENTEGAGQPATK